MDQMKMRWHRYHYKNITYVLLSFVGAIVLFRLPQTHVLLKSIGTLGYVGAFFGGMLFVSTFTVSIGSVILITLTETLHPVGLSLCAGLGAVIADCIIFRYIRSDAVTKEIQHFFNHFGSDRVRHLIHSKYFGWTLPVIGAIIIASSLPDELGVGLMGISKMKTWQFVLLSFCLHVTGILLLTEFVALLR